GEFTSIEPVVLTVVRATGASFSGSVPCLSGHTFAFQWCSLPRVRRHRSSYPQVRSNLGCFLSSPDERKGGEFGTTTGSSVAPRRAGDPPYTLLDADDRLLHV
ncbi:unnamed protein product, partial [Ascophyllum nodosum]